MLYVKHAPLLINQPGTVLFLRRATPQLSLPLQRFTPEFEMGQSGSTAPEAPGKPEKDLQRP